MNLAERIVQEEENARIDVMTGLPNRRVYEEDMKHFAEEPLPKDLHYVVVDINGLKDVNDSYGHETGDKLIVGAARCFEEVFRGWGRQYRIGGDEFAAVLTDRDYENRDELLRLFDERCLEKRNQEKDAWEQVDVARGMAVYDPEEHDSVYGVVRRADKIMYEHK